MFLDNCLGDSYVPPFEGIINQPTTAVPLGTSDWLSDFWTTCPLYPGLLIQGGICRSTGNQCRSANWESLLAG